MTRTQIPVAQRDIDRVVAACAEAWSRDTTLDADGWSPTNPALGQCAVTSLVIQDLLGGQLLRGALPGGSHYWNLLEDGREVDATRGQFDGDFAPTEVQERAREYVLSFPETMSRYERLRARVAAALGDPA